ncbi:MAG: ABC transporter permease [Chloroflexi bacterium]|nr:ABC transporter permease [Chloroflexota bacterium]MCL5075098.1 ABC transporter permease [Chloroflexota bacterium]
MHQAQPIRAQEIARVNQGVIGRRLFTLATVGSLVFLGAFIVALLLSMAWYTNPQTIRTILASPELAFAIKLSVITATLSTILSITLAIPAAYTLSRYTFWGKHIVDVLLDIPLVLPPISLGVALLVFFNTPMGTAIERSGLRFVFEQPGIILAQFAVVSSFAVRMMKATFDSIGPRYENVARTLGCSQTRAFFAVTLPLAKNGLLAALVLTWARAMGEFGATVTFVGATKMKTEIMSIAIFLSLSSANVEQAVALVYVLITVAAMALIILRYVGGESYRIE